jgi:hypothetical protein
MNGGVMFQKIQDWMKSHNVTTHTLAVAIAGTITLYEQVPAFHDLVGQIYTHIPTGLHSVITAGLAVYAFYRRGTDPQK